MGLNSFTANFNHHFPLYVGDGKVKEHGKFTITCVVQKGPIEWHKDRVPIESQDLLRTIYQNGSEYWSTLTISGATLRHKGKYHCIHDNKTSHFVDVETDDENSIESLTNNLETVQIVTKARSDKSQLKPEVETFTPFDDNEGEDEYHDKVRIPDSNYDKDYVDPTEAIKESKVEIKETSPDYNVENSEMNESLEERNSKNQNYEEEIEIPNVITTEDVITFTLSTLTSTSTENSIVEITTTIPSTSEFTTLTQPSTTITSTTTTLTPDEEFLHTPLSIRNQGSK